MWKSFHQALLTLQTEWPKALIGSAIPLSQYGWKLWKERQTETKKKCLRETIRELAQFRLVALPDDAESARIKSDADREYAEAVAKLAEICALERMAAAQRSGVNKPPDVVIAPPAVVMAPNPPAAMRDNGEVRMAYEEAAATLGGEIEVIEKQAVAAPASKPWYQRWFLLYVPSRPIAWIPQTIYFLLLFFNALLAFGILSTLKEGGTGTALIGLLVCVGVNLLFRSWAVRANTDPAARASATKPLRRWISVAVTIAALFFEAMFVIGISLDDNEEMSLRVLRQNYAGVLTASIVVAGVIFAVWYRRRRQT